MNSAQKQESFSGSTALLQGQEQKMDRRGSKSSSSEITHQSVKGQNNLATESILVTLRNCEVY